MRPSTPTWSCSLIAALLLAACGSEASHAATNLAIPAAHAPATARIAIRTPPFVATSTAAVGTNASHSVNSDSSERPSASLAGVVHDADVDPALLKDLFVLPGAITGDTEPAGLRRIYGASNVKEGDVPGGEGETAHGVILFPDDPVRRAYVYFQDENTLTGLSMVRVMDENSRWHSTQGIHIGTPLAQLISLNGKPFQFSGFDWDYGGQVTDWLGGKLAPAKGGPTLHVALTHATSPKGVPSSKLPIGDGSFRSDHPQLAKMKVTVAEISLGFPGKGDH